LARKFGKLAFMKRGRTSQDTRKVKRPVGRQKKPRLKGIEVIKIGDVRYAKSRGRPKLPSFVIHSDFDSATGLTAFSDRVYEPAAKHKAARLKGLAFFIKVTGPILRMDTNALKELHGYSDEEIYSLVVPKRTLARRTAEKQPLSAEETDRAIRLARIGKIAETIFGNAEKAHRWLRKPKQSLEGETPLNYLASETGARVVEEMLTRIDHGILP
jgi:putative toxin-antitoxin system antitoxin component (TIGR02293 family)